jgi:hypothetical protein
VAAAHPLRLIRIPEKIEEPRRGLAWQEDEKHGCGGHGRRRGPGTEDTHHKTPV